MAKQRSGKIRVRRNKQQRQPVLPAQEGFERAIGLPKDGVPACSSGFSAHGYSLNDFRGDITDGKRNVCSNIPRTKTAV